MRQMLSRLFARTLSPFHQTTSFSGRPTLERRDSLQDRRSRQITELNVTLEEFFAFRNRFFASGCASHPTLGIRNIVVAFSSGIVRSPFRDAAEASNGPLAPRLRSGQFAIDVPQPLDQATADIELWFELDDESVARVPNSSVLVAERQALGPDLFKTFLDALGRLENGAVLEIGSRDRSHMVRKQLIPQHLRYVGLDVKPGPNVDVVGDAHRMTEVLGGAQFDGVFGIATFEHILMPWVAAVQMNKVMKLGAIAFVHSHQSFPLHEQPWDFWRFSDQAWRGLFNEFSGFEIIDANMGGAVQMVPHHLDNVTYGMEKNLNAYLSSVVLCRKIGETVLEWPVDPDRILVRTYPQ